MSQPFTWYQSLYGECLKCEENLLSGKVAWMNSAFLGLTVNLVECGAVYDMENARRDKFGGEICSVWDLCFLVNVTYTVRSRIHCRGKGYQL